MRILLAIEPGGGGVGRHVVDLASGLVSRGHDIELVYSPCRAEQWFLDAIDALDIPLHPVPLLRATNWRDAGTAVLLRRLVKRARPLDIVHGHSSKAGALLRIAATGFGAKRVYTPHALVTLSPDLSPHACIAYRLAERVLARFADGIICVSEEERQHAIQIGISEKRLHVVNNGLDKLPPPERSEVRRSLGLRPDDICIGFVGRLAAQKAVGRLIEAFAIAEREQPRLRLVIVGDGEDREALQAMVNARGVAGKARFISDSRGSWLMSGFDLFALTSRYEAFPYVFLEAAARGLPIVTTDVGGASAVVRPGINGFIVPQHEPGQLPEQLVKLAADDGLRARMAAQSRRIAAKFTLESMVDNTLGVYRRILAVLAQGPAVNETAGGISSASTRNDCCQ